MPCTTRGETGRGARPAAPRGRPRRAGYHDIKVGYSCNNNCVHCVIADNRSALRRAGRAVDLDTPQCLALIRQAADDGYQGVVLTGGEPTIRADFLQLLRACAASDLAAEVQTNGRAFASPALCDEIDFSGPTRFTVAVHGPDAAVHDAISRRPGSFAQTQRGLGNLRARGAVVSGKVVISRVNQGSLVGIVRLLARIGVQRCNMAFPHGLGNARRQFIRVVPRFRELQAELADVLREAEVAGIVLDLEAIPFCIVRDRPDAVAELSFLAKQPRVYTPVGDETRDWQRDRILQKTQGPQCRRCCYWQICEGPWNEYVRRYGTEELRPVELDALAFGRLMRQVARPAG
jgi:MoaA/NifB/PqqE/SkfB family radical SAM enzyme